ncbi:MAG: hypothetical protein E7223_05665 [Clostridiales bacterium]|nr:hypothetical protein [Clostridiales bacterium]
MEILKNLFPFSFKPKANWKDLLIWVVVLLIADLVCGVIIGILGHLPLIGWIAGIIGGLLGLYFTVSIVLAVLDFLKVLK